MRPPGFFDLEDRFAKLDGLGDPLLKIAQVVDWDRVPLGAEASFYQGAKEQCRTQGIRIGC